jgi:flagellar basal-body rod protein FlgB
MFFTDVVNSSSIPTLSAMLSFTQAQHRVLAENIANIDTPGYRIRHLEPRRFQRALAGALARGRDSGQSLRIAGGPQFEQDPLGRLRFTPGVDPAENLLFHDNTNARIERQMSMLAENAMMHQALTDLLAGNYQGLMKAIRGQGA